MVKIELDLEITPEAGASIHYLIDRIASFLDKTEALDGIDEVLIQRLLIDNRSLQGSAKE